MRPQQHGQPDGRGERRQFQRYTLRLDAQVWRETPPPDFSDSGPVRRSEQVRLNIRDISLGGLRGDSPTAMRRGEPVVTRMRTLAHRPALVITGRVVRCQRCYDGFDIGLAFCQAPDASRCSPWLRLPELFCLVPGTPSPAIRPQPETVPTCGTM